MSRPSLVVFAAGRGTRLRPLTDRLPKAMVPVLDVPLIDLALSRASGGSSEWEGALVNVSGPAPGLREHLSKRAGIEVFDEGPEPLGQAATLRRLLPRLSDLVLTYNCDLVSDIDLALLLEQHTAGGGACTLAVEPVDHMADLTAGPSGRLRLVDRRVEDSPGYLYLGAACFDRRLLEAIPGGRPLGLAAGVLRRAVEEGKAVLYQHPGYGFDSGSLDRYLSVSRAALEWMKISPGPPGEISPGGWYLGPGARVEGTCGAGAVVLAEATVQGGARLGECVVWPGSTVPPGTYRHGIWFEGRWLPVPGG